MLKQKDTEPQAPEEIEDQLEEVVGGAGANQDASAMCGPSSGPLLLSKRPPVIKRPEN